VWGELPLSGDCPSRSIDPRAETAILQVSTTVAHPIAGAGYLATLSLPAQQAREDAAEICRRLNEAEMEQTDFIPRLGAWGVQGQNELPGYCCFLPCAEPQTGLHITMLWWLAIRGVWLRDRFWAPQQGIVFDKVPAPATQPGAAAV